MKKSLPALLTLILAALACSLPSPRAATSTPGAEAIFTQAAQTVEARLTTSAPASPTLVVFTPATAFPSLTPLALPTQPPATATPQPCNLASFVQDVTIPDDTQIPTGGVFIKTWRLKNVGTCTWTASYSLVFDHGDAMGSPAAQALTVGAVAPGQTVDVSISLIAPTSAGTYQGFWLLRDAGSVLFGLSTGPFWAKIRAIAPTATPSLTPTASLTPAPSGGTYTAALVASESGSVRSSGEKLNAVNLGDVESNAVSQAFLSFDISGLSPDATITEVKINFSNYDMLGDPFGGLGCMRIYAQDYGALDVGDYFSGSPLGALARWCNPAELSAESIAADMRAALQAKLGSARFQVRAQFNDNPGNNGNGIADMVRLGNTIKLLIAYTLP